MQGDGQVLGKPIKVIVGGVDSQTIADGNSAYQKIRVRPLNAFSAAEVEETRRRDIIVRRND